MTDTTQLQYIMQQLNIYAGLSILILGVIGNILNVIIFANVKTAFAKNSCSFYFVATALTNLLCLLIGLLAKVLASGSGIDPTVSSSAFCRFRSFFMNTAPLISTNFTCLAAITQFLVTSRHIHYRQKINSRFIRWTILMTILFWTFHGILYLILYNINLPSTTSMLVCNSINTVLKQYMIWMSHNVLIFVAPVLILVVFGYLTYRNIMSLNFATSNRQRAPGKRIQRQLTVVSDIHLIFTRF
jgi:hypothetical protein